MSKNNIGKVPQRTRKSMKYTSNVVTETFCSGNLEFRVKKCAEEGFENRECPAKAL